MHFSIFRMLLLQRKNRRSAFCLYSGCHFCLEVVKKMDLPISRMPFCFQKSFSVAFFSLLSSSTCVFFMWFALHKAVNAKIVATGAVKMMTEADLEKTSLKRVFLKLPRPRGKKPQPLPGDRAGQGKARQVRSGPVRSGVRSGHELVVSAPATTSATTTSFTTTSIILLLLLLLSNTYYLYLLPTTNYRLPIMYCLRPNTYMQISTENDMNTSKSNDTERISKVSH